MPASRTADASVFEERLSLPWVAWLVVGGVLLVGGAEVAAGFTWEVALGVYAALGVPTVAVLALVGRARVRVDAAGVHAGGRTLRYDEIDTVESLGVEETRMRLGPHGDPSAHVVTRGWIHTSVLLVPLEPAPTPYWLLSTRHPDRVVAAVAAFAAR